MLIEESQVFLAKESKKKRTQELWFFFCLSGTYSTSENATFLLTDTQKCFTFIISMRGTHAENIKYNTSGGAKTTKESVSMFADRENRKTKQTWDYKWHTAEIAASDLGRQAQLTRFDVGSHSPAARRHKRSVVRKNGTRDTEMHLFIRLTWNEDAFWHA